MVTNDVYAALYVHPKSRVYILLVFIIGHCIVEVLSESLPTLPDGSISGYAWLA